MFHRLHIYSACLKQPKIATAVHARGGQPCAEASPDSGGALSTSAECACCLACELLTGCGSSGARHVLRLPQPLLQRRAANRSVAMATKRTGR